MSNTSSAIRWALDINSALDKARDEYGLPGQPPAWLANALRFWPEKPVTQISKNQMLLCFLTLARQEYQEHCEKLALPERGHPVSFEKAKAIYQAWQWFLAGQLEYRSGGSSFFIPAPYDIKYWGRRWKGPQTEEDLKKVLLTNPVEWGWSLWAWWQTRLDSTVSEVYGFAAYDRDPFALPSGRSWDKILQQGEDVLPQIKWR